MLPNNFPPWAVVYQQFRRWLEAGCFEALVSDMRSIIRTAQGRQGQPSAVIFDGRTLAKQLRQAGRVLNKTATNGATARRCMRLSIRWVI